MAALDPWINSAGQDGYRNAMAYFAGDGTRTSFEFNFAGGYISRSDIRAYVYDTSNGTHTEIDPVVLTGPNTIEVSPAIGTNKYLVVYRDTPKAAPLVDFVNGAVLNEENLDLITKQAVFSAAEMVDRFDEINTSSADAIARSWAAVQAANEATEAANTAAGVANNAAAEVNAAVETVNNMDERVEVAVQAAESAEATADDLMDSVGNPDVDFVAHYNLSKG